MRLLGSKFENTLGQEISMLPFADFLSDFSEYGQCLADVIVEWAKAPAPISASRIQRKCMIRYSVAEAIMQTLVQSGVAVELHEPLRTEVCIDDSTAEWLPRLIVESLADYKPEQSPAPEKGYTRVVKKTKKSGTNPLEYVLEGYTREDGIEMVRITVLSGYAYIIRLIGANDGSATLWNKTVHYLLAEGDSLDMLCREVYNIYNNESDVWEFEALISDMAAYSIYYSDAEWKNIDNGCGKHLFD